jgi:hypothetical protein
MGGSRWADVFSPHLLAPDYPLLMPSLVARSWTFYGYHTQLLPAAVAMGFTFASVLLLYSSLCIFKSRSQGILGSLLLMGTPFFIEDGAGLCADVPLAYYVLCLYVLLLFSARSPENDNCFFLIGLASGCVLWTKHEGALFVVALLLSQLVVLPRRMDAGRFFRKAVRFGAGFIPLFSVFLFVKCCYPP